MIFNEALEQFLRADKPGWCRGQDVAIIAYLLTVANADGKCAPTQQELTKATGAGAVNLAGLRNSLERLKENKWITWVKAGPRMNNIYTVRIENLPRKEDDEAKSTP
jgi:hypothetical protein